MRALVDEDCDDKPSSEQPGLLGWTQQYVAVEGARNPAKVNVV